MNFQRLSARFLLPKGQAMVTLLSFTAIGITVITAIAVMIYANLQSSISFQQGVLADEAAEAGVENALLRLLRNPSYTGETLQIGNGTAVILVTGTGPYTITSTGTYRNFQKKIEVVATYTNNLMQVTSKKEVY